MASPSPEAAVPPRRRGVSLFEGVEQPLCRRRLDAGSGILHLEPYPHRGLGQLAFGKIPDKADEGARVGIVGHADFDIELGAVAAPVASLEQLGTLPGNPGAACHEIRFGMIDIEAGDPHRQQRVLAGPSLLLQAPQSLMRLGQPAQDTVYARVPLSQSASRGAAPS
jgi:hypothetical protein